jgi:hypothetical protein
LAFASRRFRLGHFGISFGVCSKPASSRKTEAMINLGCIDSQRPSEAFGSKPPACDLQHLIKLGAGKIDPLVFDRMNARTEREQVHEKLLGLDRIVRTMDAPFLDVMRNDAVFDCEFAEHGNFCSMFLGWYQSAVRICSMKKNLHMLIPPIDHPLRTRSLIFCKILPSTAFP